jgi:glycosyl transferase family 25
VIPPAKSTFAFSKSKAGNMKLGIFVINLDRSSGRLASISNQLKHLSLAWQRLPALDAANPDDLRAASEHYSPNLNKRLFRRPLSNSEIACFASHRRAWETLLATDWRGAIILEDDAFPSDNFPTAVTALEASLNEWQAVKLFTYRPVPILSQKPLFSGNIETSGASHPPRPRFYLCDYLKTPVCTTAYSVTREAAAQLLKTSTRFGRPVDVHQQFYWETSVRFQGLLPLPVPQTAGFPSEINNSNRESHKTKHRFFTHLANQISFNCETYRRALFSHGFCNTFLRRPRRQENFLPKQG